MYTTNLIPTTTTMSSSVNGIVIWGIIAAILALVGGILVHFLFVNSKNDPKGKFAKWLKDFLAFKIMWLETILKILYYFGTIFSVLFSFAMIGSSFLAFIVFFICIPVILRLVYESSIMFIMIWRNTADISKAVAAKPAKAEKKTTKK